MRGGMHSHVYGEVNFSTLDSFFKALSIMYSFLRLSFIGLKLPRQTVLAVQWTLGITWLPALGLQVHVPHLAFCGVPGLELWSFWLQNIYWRHFPTVNTNVTGKWFYLLAIHVWSFTHTVELATKIYVEIILHNVKDPPDDQFVLGRPQLCQWRVSQHGSKGFHIFWRLLNMRRKYLYTWNPSKRWE